jgi:uncharacterized protein YecE (DUF72 family)
MSVLIGCSGWQYKHWRHAFYPEGLAQKRWLDHYTERFQTVELNNSFYRLPEAHTFAKWAEGTPKDFVMTVKASRYLTHIRRLREPEEPVQRFSDNARSLGAKLGPVLLQLPPNLKKDAPALKDTLSTFDRRTFNLAVEFRHDSWFDEEVMSILEDMEACLVLADRGSRPVSPPERTADWGYVRLHWGTGAPDSCYGGTALASWAERIAELWGRNDDVYVYFNNDPNGCALRDSIVFARECEKRGLEPTRVPSSKDVHVKTGTGRQS